MGFQMVHKLLKLDKQSISDGFSKIALNTPQVHTFNPLEEKQLRAQTLYPHTRLLQERECGQLQDVALSEEEELLQHSVAVK